ncbi:MULTISPECIES: phosphate ABC transporter substrate-binding protein [unclassified Methanoregula]|uniref:phosphate ABC transporter substrate-binding protein n=1 Tax=unclassified Methanoregula TaxID=2649730 RepID=UPI0009C8AB69|nr:MULTISPECIES: phosphate ABC transporter substrate-binding protein [unclassified Methanoregula]OPX63635.1 MAG: PBP superfamily domain protein [Methanoregula sp. PtaB.Bin085]OPY36199.1 MAG: PBP superfamily domain protein [Methanoregula sp. PtaU1.Bin006]
MNGKQNRYLVIAGSLVAVIMLALAAGCTTQTNTTPAATKAPADHATITDAAGAPAAAAATIAAPVSTATPVSSGQRQKIKISGSTTVLPIVQKAADKYMATHANADIQVSGGGSGVGIQAIGAKTVDIGMSSREVTADEKKKYASFVITPVAQDGIAVVVNPANSIRYITLEQIRNIYLGKTTKWTEISGADVPGTNNQIVVVGRDSASGTRSYFDETLLAKKTPTKQMLEKNSNGAVLQTVAQTPGAIGYVSIGFVSKDVKALPIWYNADRIVAPNLANVKDKTYPVSRELYLITNGQPSGLTGDFIRYILSEEGQKIVADEGYVTV